MGRISCLATAEQRRPRPRKLVDVRYRARGPYEGFGLRGPFLLTGRGRLDGRPKALLSDPKLSHFYGAGEAMVEPPNVKMIGLLRSTTEPMRGCHLLCQ